MSDEAAISAQGAAEDRIRRASARFVSYDPRTGRNAKGQKAPGFSPVSKRAIQLAEAKARYLAKKKAERAAPDRSQQATEREARKREERGNTCINGHAMAPDNVSSVGNGVFNCIACRRSRQVRSNEMRRLRSTLRAA